MLSSKLYLNRQRSAKTEPEKIGCNFDPFSKVQLKNRIVIGNINIY